MHPHDYFVAQIAVDEHRRRVAHHAVHRRLLRRVAMLRRKARRPDA